MPEDVECEIIFDVERKRPDYGDWWVVFASEFEDEFTAVQSAEYFALTQPFNDFRVVRRTVIMTYRSKSIPTDLRA